MKKKLREISVRLDDLDSLMELISLNQKGTAEGSSDITVYVKDVTGWPPMSYDTKGCQVTFNIQGCSSDSLIKILARLSKARAECEREVEAGFRKQIEEMINNGTF